MPTSVRWKPEETVALSRVTDKVALPSATVRPVMSKDFWISISSETVVGSWAAPEPILTWVKTMSPSPASARVRATDPAVVRVIVM